MSGSEITRPIEDRVAVAMPISPSEFKAAEEADARGDYGSPVSRLVRVADARDATAQALRELRARPGAGAAELRAYEEQIRSYDVEIEQIRAQVVPELVE